MRLQPRRFRRRDGQARASDKLNPVDDASKIEEIIDHLDATEFQRLTQHIHQIEAKRWHEQLPAPGSLSRISLALYLSLVLALFLWCGSSKASFQFDADDLMNLHQSFVVKPSTLLAAAVLPFSTFNRPIGTLYYRLCFSVFGWNPAAFRIVTYAIMTANFLLVWLLARRLTGSMETGGAAALLYSFHARLLPLYSSNGTVYDVLCAFFLLLTLLYYMSVRQRGLSWQWSRVTTVLALYIAALNSKEIAAVIPALILIFEYLYFRSHRHEKFLRKALFGLALAALTAIALWAKMRAGGPFHEDSSYAVSFTIKRFFQNERSLISQLFYLPERYLSTRQVIAIWVSLFVIPIRMNTTHRRALWFSAAFAMLAPLPMIFLPARSFYVMYIPLMGWAIYAAILLVLCRNWIVREFRRLRPMGVRGWKAAHAALALATSFAVLQGTREADYNLPHIDPTRTAIAGTAKDFLTLREPLPERSRTILLHSRFPDDAWGPLMLARLLYRDPNLWIDRPTIPLKNIPTDAQLAQYDRVFDFDGRRLIVLSRRPPGEPARTMLVPH